MRPKRVKEPVGPDPVVGRQIVAMQRRFAGRFQVLVSMLEEPGRIVITRLEPDRLVRGQGWERRVLEEICWWADEHGHTLVITPAGTGADMDRLTTLYAAVGFEVSREPRRRLLARGPMIREPRTRGAAGVVGRG